MPFNNRRKYFLNGVPAFTYPGFLHTDGSTSNPCCAVDTGYFGNDADDKYNALQIKAKSAPVMDFQFLAHYTFSHAYDYDADLF